MSVDARQSFSFTVFLLVVASVAMLLGLETGRREIRQEAVEAGHAEYYIDDNNDRRWRWKESE